VRESFTEYKKTLEQNLMNISYLYNGDVISSIISQYTEVKNSNIISPTFIINTIVNIYQESIDMMIDRSKEFIITLESINSINIFDKISELGIEPLYIFCSDRSRRFFSMVKSNNTSAFPSYLYPIDKYVSTNVSVFYSPLIKDDYDELILYVVDKSIQSLVYSIQNMDYIIDSNCGENLGWKHTINYNLYDCKFNSYKLSIRDVSRLRNDKINHILNDN